MRGQREKIQNGQTGNNRFEDESGRECRISREGPDCTVEVYMLEVSEEEVIMLQVGTRQGGSSRSESCQEF